MCYNDRGQERHRRRGLGGLGEERPTAFYFDAETETGYVDRLMVAAGHQSRGYGRAAMSEVIRRLRDTPGCVRIRTSFEPSNSVAEGLYHSLGFRRTGEMVGGEVVVVLELPENSYAGKEVP